jgi:uncharacterized membrane protein
MSSTSEADLETLGNKPRTYRFLAYLFAAILIGIWLSISPSGLLGKADAIGYAVCHRIDLRSFHLGERQLPLCARCSGMYLGAFLSLIYFQARRPRAGLFPQRMVIYTFVVFALLWAVDGFNSFMHLLPFGPRFYTPSNTLRLITGSLMGIPLATMVYPLFNQTMWREWKPVPVLKSLRDLIPLLALTTVLILLILSENSLILYPLALLSSVGVLVLLGVIYTTLTVTVTRRENQAKSWGDLILHLSIGVTFAVLQVLLIASLRAILIGDGGW